MLEIKNFEKVKLTVTAPDGKSYTVPAAHDPEHAGNYVIDAAALPKELQLDDTPGRTFRIKTAISDVNGKEGKLSYRGYNINDLVSKASYEETAYLLLMGDLPTKDQLATFKMHLASKAVLDEDKQKQLMGVLKNITLTENTNPTSLMSTLMGVLDANENLPTKTQKDRYETALTTMATMPTLIGLVNARLKAGNPPDKMDSYQFPSLGDFDQFGEKFSYSKLLMSALKQKPMDEIDPKEAAAIDKYLILHAEHGLNLSTFTARTVSSGESVGGGWRITLGAMQSLAGNRHGNASNDALDNLKKILARPEETIAAKVDAYIQEIDKNYAASKIVQARGEEYKGPSPMVEGIGHAIYQAPDPRAGALQKILHEVQDKLKDSQLLEVALTLQTKLAEHERFGKKPEKPLFPNVDFCSGVLLTQYLGIDERLMTGMFAVGRDIGWHAHAAEHARDSKGIVRPEAIPLAVQREFIPIEERDVPAAVVAAQATSLFPKPNVLVRAAAV